MEFRIEHKPAFKAAGKSIRVSMKDVEKMTVFGQFWEKCALDGTLDHLNTLESPGSVLGPATLGLCTDFTSDMSEFTYSVGVETNNRGDLGAGIAVFAIPETDWAVFGADGPVLESIQAAWTGIFADFFPNEPYGHGSAPDLEVYPPGDPSQPGYRYEIWVPVVKK
jgi:AraC family transcriptional regulator